MGEKDLADFQKAARVEGPNGDRARDYLAANEPPLTEYEKQYWIAFADLSTERMSGMATGPIGYLRIVEYAKYHGLSQLQTDIMIRIIRTMDAHYMQATAEAMNKPDK